MKSTVCWRNKFFSFGMIVFLMLFVIGCSPGGWGDTPRGTAPTITSTNSANFIVGTAGTFTVTATGTPTPTFALTGDTLPSGITFNTLTGVLSGTPDTGTGGTYSLTITASNGVSPDATQNFTLMVIGAFNTSSLPLTVTDGSPIFSFAFDGNGNLLFIALNAGELRSLDRITGTVTTVATGLPGSTWRGIVYQDSSSIFVGAMSGSIYKVNPTDGSTTTLITISGGGWINCLAIAPATFTPYGGQLIAASNTGIYAIDQSLASPTVTQISNIGGDEASSLVFGSDGTLYVALREDNKIVTMTAAGVATDFATVGLSGPDGLAIDNNAGLLYVTNDGDATIKSVTIPGGTVSTFTTGLSFSGGWAPSPIIVDVTSNILLVGHYPNLTISYFDLP